MSISGYAIDVGTRVRLRSDRWGDSENNPVWGGAYGEMFGVVTEHENDSWGELHGESIQFKYKVSWDNGTENSYSDGDLGVVCEEAPVGVKSIPDNFREYVELAKGGEYEEYRRAE